MELFSSGVSPVISAFNANNKKQFVVSHLEGDFVIHLTSPTAQDNPTHQSYLQTEIPALASFYSSVCWMMKLEHYFPTWEHLKPAKILRVSLRLAK